MIGTKHTQFFAFWVLGCALGFFLGRISGIEYAYAKYAAKPAAQTTIQEPQKPTAENPVDTDDLPLPIDATILNGYEHALIPSGIQRAKSKK